MICYSIEDVDVFYGRAIMIFDSTKYFSWNSFIHYGIMFPKFRWIEIEAVQMKSCQSKFYDKLSPLDHNDKFNYTFVLPLMNFWI
jgi:hypothetical protein